MKKEVVGIIAFVIIVVILGIYGLDRFEKIHDGKMIVVNENQMDR